MLPVDEVTADIERLESELAESRAQADEFLNVLHSLDGATDHASAAARLQTARDLLTAEELAMTRFSVLEHVKTTLAGLQPPAPEPVEEPKPAKDEKKRGRHDAR